MQTDKFRNEAEEEKTSCTYIVKEGTDPYGSKLVAIFKDVNICFGETEIKYREHLIHILQYAKES